MMAIDPSRIDPGMFSLILGIASMSWGLELTTLTAGLDEPKLQHIIAYIAERTDLLLELVNYNIVSQQYVCAGHVSA